MYFYVLLSVGLQFMCYMPTDGLMCEALLSPYRSPRAPFYDTLLFLARHDQYI